MSVPNAEGPLTTLAEQAKAIYDHTLKANLEPAHNGEAVAIHVDTGDYAVARDHSSAARIIIGRHQVDGRVVTITIGSPTDADLRLAARIATGRKR